MELAKNYFELFGMPQHFLIDAKHLSNRYRELQKDIHPDKYAKESASEQRIAVQFTSYVNTAYNTLKSPLLRAKYLLSLQGHSIDDDAKTIKDKAFLFKQLEWREQLSFIDKSHVDCALSEIDTMRCKVSDESKTLYECFSRHLENNDLANAEQVIAKLHFTEKLLTELNELEMSLDG